MCQTTEIMFNGSEPGCGAGKGGGAGGSIREAGGSLGKREATLEDEYFRRLDKQNIEALKDKLNKKTDNENQSSMIEVWRGST
ncbi:atpase inhibitor isoform 1 [Schistosoma japonicum]|uniref:Atpase inhibitor isoform 1 n=1 Tax=Schistosoma japonicum TaxID=6182 RepID=A0A4Z2DFT7_SCHJA|nr:atpase inhibitor isoform 1 [Schistosoma japonicum]TNN15327.1 atpase inhibitor isoform 1 [Schistosoma japonicum]